MGAIIAIVIVLVLVGSLMWLKPSAAQQRQTKMRLLARQLGLDVRLCSLPQTRRARVREETPTPGVVYRLLSFGDRKAAAIELLLCRVDAESEWESENAAGFPEALHTAIEPILKELPADTVAFEITPTGCGIYWRELGGEDAVHRVQRCLEATRNAVLQFAGQK